MRASYIPKKNLPGALMRVRARKLGVDPGAPDQD